ncbi:MAG: hypothetical protein F4X92_10965 [Gammaproteobacteria bacterium]|nr:hypothetical protein [Gammaproteobacteria bacterium]
MASKAFYAIIPLGNEPPDDLKKKIQNVSKSVYIGYGPNVYFVEYSGSIQDLSDRIGFSDGKNSTAGIVIKMKGYYGFASLSLWEWLAQDEG